MGFLRKIGYVIFAVCLLINQSTKIVSADIGSWQKSSTISPNSSTDFSSASFKQSVSNMSKTGTNYLTIIIPITQANQYSTDVKSSWNTPTDQSLGDAIDFAHSLGMAVNVKIHDDPADGNWRAIINPSDRITWFNNYGFWLNHFGSVAQAHHAEEMTIGAELIYMTNQNLNSTNTANWQRLIGSLKGVYFGKLTYSAQRNDAPQSSWVNEVENIGFWNQLDYLGLSAYYNLSGSSVQELENSWNAWNSGYVSPLSRYGKPILFTEVGYKSVSGAAGQPWNWGLGGNYDPTIQANAYQALFNYWSKQSNFAGVHLWDWSSNPNAGGNGNIDYTPQNKPAQAVMASYFGGSGNQSGGGNTPPPPVNTTPPNFSDNVSVSPPSVNSGTSTALSVNVKNNTNAIQNDYQIDLEVQNSSGTKVFQQFWEHQNFSANGSNTFAANWTPSGNGTYSVAVGIFTSGWVSNVLWDQKTTINVGSTPAPTPTPTPAPTPTPTPTPTPAPTPVPVSGQINIWWPTNGASVGGVLPFKGMMTNLNLADYNMFWQVDGGSLNQMGDSQTDYPHKESTVDVGSWNWNSNNQYKLTFVAKDKSGNQIASQDVMITVTR